MPVEIPVAEQQTVESGRAEREGTATLEPDRSVVGMERVWYDCLGDWPS